MGELSLPSSVDTAVLAIDASAPTGATSVVSVAWLHSNRLTATQAYFSRSDFEKAPVRCFM
jgi:hypothetical protein